MSTVLFQHIFKNYGVVEALKDITIEVKDGEFAALLGPSGCGKSTLLRLTAGLEPITSGDLYIDGDKVNAVHPRDRDIAMVFQNYALYPQMNVYNNIAFSLQVKKTPKEEVEKQVRWAVGILKIEALLDRYPHELSGGQRQRVAMGRAIVRDPKVFLFDEPLSNLDAKLRERMRFEVRTLHNRLKATTIYVTHDQVEAMTMADKIIVMRKGVIQQVGSPETVFDKPANLFVADFIGTPSINLISGKLYINDGQPVFRYDDGALPMPPNIRVENGRRIVYGIRPQHIRVLTEPSSSEQNNTVRAELLLSETTGTETQFSFDLDGEHLTVVNQGRFRSHPNTFYSLQFDTRKVHFLTKIVASD